LFEFFYSPDSSGNPRFLPGLKRIAGIAPEKISTKPS
jgi:hypothetical protein